MVSDYPVVWGGRGYSGPVYLDCPKCQSRNIPGLFFFGNFFEKKEDQRFYPLAFLLRMFMIYRTALRAFHGTS